MTLLLELAPLALLATGVALCSGIFLTLKRDLQAVTQRLQEQQRGVDNVEQRLTAQFEEVRKSLREAEERAAQLVPPAAPRSGFNLSKRSQALRLSRHGERPENIAAALAVPRKEIELLLKVQKIVLASAGATSSPREPADEAPARVVRSE